MLRYIFLGFFCLLGTVLGNGEFVVFNAPPSVKFVKTTKNLPADLVPDVILANLGFTTSSESSWPGLIRVSPFRSAKLAVIYSLDGPSARLPSEVTSRILNIARYPVLPMPGEGTGVWWQILRQATEQRSMLNATATLLTLEFTSESDVSNGLDIGSLDPSIDEDKTWLKEMQSLRSVIQKATNGEYCSKTNGPSILWLESTALHALIDLHGDSSEQTIQACKMLGSMLAGINEALQSSCDDKLFFAAITSDAAHTRRTRSILAVDAKDQNNPFNLSKAYDKNYSVMFTIFLLFGIGFVFALLAISIAIASMDPGRDSIIYRMTSTRMKKDN